MRLKTDEKLRSRRMAILLTILSALLFSGMQLMVKPAIFVPGMDSGARYRL